LTSDYQRFNYGSAAWAWTQLYTHTHTHTHTIGGNKSEQFETFQEVRGLHTSITIGPFKLVTTVAKGRNRNLRNCYGRIKSKTEK